MEEINLKDLFDYFKSKLIIILCIGALGGILGFVYTNYLKTPLYNSYTTIVLTMTNSGSSTSITQNDVVLNQKLVSTYREIMKSRRILDYVIDNLNLDMSSETLSKKITVKSENDTELIKITVSDSDAEKAKMIANEITDVFKEEIVNIYNIENVSVIDKAVVAIKPYNISVAKSSAIASLIGMILSAGAVFMMFYFDTTIKSASDIEEKIGLPVLGKIPAANMKRGA